VDFNDKDLKDDVLIVADNTQMTRVLSEFTSCDALVRDVLFNNISMDSNTVLTAFENKKLFKIPNMFQSIPIIQNDKQMITSDQALNELKCSGFATSR
jgi:hypothetical protein